MSFLNSSLKAVLGLMALSACLAVVASAEEKREPANLPENDIFLFDLNWSDEGVLSNVRNVTARPGYDNQPAFTSGSESFLFSRGDLYQTDVYEYDIASRKIRQITDTPTNEFSPMASPDNKELSFVTDGPGAYQNIARTTREDPAKIKKLLPGEALREPVGYYAWDHSNGHVLFWSRYGSNVTFAHADGDDTFYVSGDAVPSTPYLIPGTDNFSFVHRQGNGETWIKAFDPDTKAVRPLTSLAGPNANYAWTPDGAILNIQDDVLFRWEEDETQSWVKVRELNALGIKDASRLSVSPDGKKLAIVGLPE